MRTVILLACLVIVAKPAEAQRRTTSVITHVTPAPVASFSIPSTEPLAYLVAADCDLDRTRGREAASMTHSGGGWMAGGLVSGVLLGLIGTAISYAIASSSTVEVNRIPEGVEASCYRDGYTSKARSMNTSNALTGGLLGTAVLVLLVVAASSGSTY
ncbi:MAG TPA: hypothetical protein VFD64_03635 [Gemmatimonadaceae bacterium]|nr:hypothetical protein [Gemmatimonadaceae bacterium]